MDLSGRAASEQVDGCRVGLCTREGILECFTTVLTDAAVDQIVEPDREVEAV